jgi:GNAT superfamily N-acetyltransferase
VTALPRIEKLDRHHDVDRFDCGREPLNRFLTHYALQNQKAGASRSYVALAGASVIGYSTLVVGEIADEAAADRLRKGLARYPVPVMILARLAIATAQQGQGLGAGVLKDAMVRTVQAADIAGIRAFIVHAKDNQAKAFYERFDFQPAPTDAHHLYLLLKDIRKLLES